MNEVKVILWCSEQDGHCISFSAISSMHPSNEIADAVSTQKLSAMCLNWPVHNMETDGALEGRQLKCCCSGKKARD